MLGIYLLESIFSCKYNVRDVLDNDTDAILSRVLYIQNREPSSMYVLCRYLQFLWTICKILIDEINN